MIKFDVLREKYVADMCAIEKECFEDPWNEEMLSGELDNPLAFYIIAHDGGRAVGYAGMHMVLDESYITNIAVTSKYRRQGIGRALLEQLLGHCRENGVYYITLEVRESNIGAQTLYEKMGFERCGRRVRYYGGIEDAIIMSRRE